VDVVDNYEKEIELGETYLRGSLTKSFDVKIGRQIVVWGKSDNIRVTDVLNPLDMREPGLIDIEDLRLPVTMSRLDYYIGDWSLTGITIHEIRFNKNPEFGSDFYPSLTPPPHEDKPDSNCKNTEYAAAINGIFSGWDVSFYWADYYNDMPHFELVPAGPPPQIELKHARLKMVGFAFNAALGNWLLKTEAAYIDGFEFFNSSEKDYSRIDVLAGIEYSGFTDTTVSLEAVNRHTNNFDDVLELPPDQAEEDEFQWVVRLTRNFLNETLSLTLLASTFGETGQDGAFQRFSAEYDITDSIEIEGGVVFYKSGDLARFRNIGDNDRLFCEIKYSF
ncbi:MAG: ligand-binding protein SH3, partial [Deltaproteobacteria bacterium]|nr:ligand-binding protein SH3 [Deltaproteobacteria bacterium]